MRVDSMIKAQLTETKTKWTLSNRTVNWHSLLENNLDIFIKNLKNILLENIQRKTIRNNTTIQIDSLQNK